MARVHGFIGCEKYHSMKVVTSQLVHLCTISVLNEWCGKSDFYCKGRGRANLCTASCSPTIDEDVDLKDFTEIKVAVSFLLHKDVHVLSLDW